MHRCRLVWKDPRTFMISHVSRAALKWNKGLVVLAQMINIYTLWKIYNLDIFVSRDNGTIPPWVKFKKYVRSENILHLLEGFSMRKQILKYKKIKKTYITKIILHNYILHKGNLTQVGTFPVDSEIHLIFTDFQRSTWCRPNFLLENLWISFHPYVYSKLHVFSKLYPGWIHNVDL